MLERAVENIRENIKNKGKDKGNVAAVLQISGYSIQLSWFFFYF
jgi:hypothetical protein